MKKIPFLTAAFLVAVSLCAFAAPIALPEPQKSGGMPLFEALSRRSSAAQRNFTSEKLTLNELSTVLWAATGKNREPKGWTVPMAMGREPYVSVYVLLDSGAYLYSWEKNELSEVSSDKSILGRAVPQGFAKTAPCILVFVDSGNAGRQGFAELAAGAMSQNVYLAAEALSLKARFLASFDSAAIESAIKAGSGSSILGIMTIGRQ